MNKKPEKHAIPLLEALASWNAKFALGLEIDDVLAYAEEGRLDLSFSVFDEPIELLSNDRRTKQKYTGYLPIDPRHALELRQTNMLRVSEVSLPDGFVKLIRETPLTVQASNLFIYGEDFIAFEEEEFASAAINKSNAHWPWGEYETRHLKILAQAASEFWADYDPANKRTAPKNEIVKEWLKGKGVSDRIAGAMVTILRADGLNPGPRK